MESAPGRPGDKPPIEDERGNELGYRNVDEEQDHDERGSRGPGQKEPRADER
jgi:hypothetical protein